MRFLILRSEIKDTKKRLKAIFIELSEVLCETEELLIHCAIPSTFVFHAPLFSMEISGGCRKAFGNSLRSYNSKSQSVNVSFTLVAKHHPAFFHKYLICSFVP